MGPPADLLAEVRDAPSWLMPEGHRAHRQERSGRGQSVTATRAGPAARPAPSPRLRLGPNGQRWGDGRDRRTRGTAGIL